MIKKLILLTATAVALGMAAAFAAGTGAQAADEIVLGASLAKTGPYSTTARTSGSLPCTCR